VFSNVMGGPQDPKSMAPTGRISTASLDYAVPIMAILPYLLCISLRASTYPQKHNVWHLAKPNSRSPHPGRKEHCSPNLRFARRPLAI
jgi:hypothetical protein